MSISRPFIVSLATLFIGFSSLRADSVPTTSDVRLTPQSRVWLLGDSTLHAYSSTAETVDFQAGLENPTPDVSQAFSSGKLKKLDVLIPVKKMKSEHAGLDKNMQKSLKAEEFPNIEFKMNSYTVRASSAQAGAFTMTVQGTLEVAGVTKNIEMEAEATPSDKALRIKGSQDLLMTDFGVKPPTILMIKTANRVVIHYDLYLTADKN